MPERPGKRRGAFSSGTDRRMRRIAAIVSGASRLNADNIVASLKDRLGDRAESSVQVVTSSAEATAAAIDAARSSDMVIAVGGDGTVADVATGIFGSSAALGIVPAGSINIIARSLGIPAKPEAALSLIAGRHQLRAIDVGRSYDRSFVHIAGAGFEAELFSATNPDLKRRMGWIAYLPAAAAALRLPPSNVRVTTDGMGIEARSPLVLIANGGSAIAPEFRIYPGISVDDGWLDVLVFTTSMPAQVAATLSFAGRQQLNRSPYATWRRAKNVKIEAVPQLAVELDGDPRGSTPREFSVVPGGLIVVTPREES